MFAAAHVLPGTGSLMCGYQSLQKVTHQAPLGPSGGIFCRWKLHGGNSSWTKMLWELQR